MVRRPRKNCTWTAIQRHRRGIPNNVVSGICLIFFTLCRLLMVHFLNISHLLLSMTEPCVLAHLLMYGMPIADSRPTFLHGERNQPAATSEYHNHRAVPSRENPTNSRHGSRSSHRLSCCNLQNFSRSSSVASLPEQWNPHSCPSLIVVVHGTMSEIASDRPGRKLQEEPRCVKVKDRH